MCLRPGQQVRKAQQRLNFSWQVLGTHLFNKPPFQNLIVNGMVLAVTHLET